MRRIAYTILILFLFAATAVSVDADIALSGTSKQGINTYGLGSVLHFGASSTLSSLVYMAGSPEIESKQTSIFDSQFSSVKPGKLSSGSLMLQNANIGLGSAKVTLGFQDIDKDFSGFESMRTSKAADYDTINQLQKEKGIKRMSFGAEMPTSGLSVLFNQIDDANDYITNWMFGYKTGSLGFTYSSREVGNDFSRFNDLKESDRNQLANEIGTKRTQYGMQYGAGPSDAITGSLSMSQIDSENGTLTQNSGDLNIGTVKVHAYVRDMNPSFSRLKAMNDEDRTQMALNARRQFDSEAQSSSVTSTDKSKVTSETGLDRTNYSVEVNAGGINTSLAYLDLDSTKGDLSRGAINMKGKNFSLYLNHHNIDKKFGKLSSLQPIEVSNFGNEYGMSRSGLGGTIKLGFGELALNAVGIKDNDGATIAKQSFDFKGNRLKVHANYQNIDPDFDRISDLSTIDKADMIGDDSGYRWSDYSINFQATKALNIDSYTYDSVNHTTSTNRNQNRLSLKYAPKSGKSSYVLDIIDVNYGNGDFINTRSLGISKKLTGNLAMVTKIAHIARDSNDSSFAGTLGFDWTIRKDLTLSANVSNTGSEVNDLRKDRQMALNGLIAKRCLFLNNITVGTGMNTTSLKGSQTTCDNAFKLQTGVIGNGTFLIDNSDKVNQTTGLYNNSRIIKYESDTDKKKPVHVKLLRQNLITSKSSSVDKRSYSADFKLSKRTSFIYKDQLAETDSSGTITNVAENIFKVNHSLSDKLAMTCDYTRQINNTDNKWANSIGMGISGKLRDNADFELYYGVCRITGGDGVCTGIYKIKFNRKLDENHYISLSAQKKSDYDTTIDTDEGRTVARLDFKTVFH